MSFLLFMDESGHDHRHAPYEVRGGIALQVGSVWTFTREMSALEQDCFGNHLQRYRSEVKEPSSLRGGVWHGHGWCGKWTLSLEGKTACRSWIKACGTSLQRALSSLLSARRVCVWFVVSFNCWRTSRLHLRVYGSGRNAKTRYRSCGKLS